MFLSKRKRKGKKGRVLFLMEKKGRVLWEWEYIRMIRRITAAVLAKKGYVRIPTLLDNFPNKSGRKRSYFR